MTHRSERSRIAALGAHEKWARCPDPVAATAPMRRGFDARFVTLADPDGARRKAIDTAGGADSPEGRQLIQQLNTSIEHHRKAYFVRLALASAKARKGRKKNGQT